MGQNGSRPWNPSNSWASTHRTRVPCTWSASLNQSEDIFPASSKETGPVDLGEGRWVTFNRCSEVRQCERPQVTSRGPRRLSPAPVHGQVLPDGHQQAGGPMLPDAFLGPGHCRLLQLFIPGLQGTRNGHQEVGSGVCGRTQTAQTPPARAPGRP